MSKGVYLGVKRFSDLILSAVLLIFFSPILAIAAVLVKLDGTGGRVLVDEPLRVGKGNEEFRMLKFRTMEPGAHERLMGDPEMKKFRKIMKNDGKIPLKDDPRVTRAGRFLRQWDIDELPQLWNVVTGKMSLVGPRPYMKPELDDFIRNDHEKSKIVETVVSVRPGITGIWQVSGRNQISLEERIRMDEAYVKSRSLVKDFKILLKTPIVVLFRVGAV